MNFGAAVTVLIITVYISYKSTELSLWICMKYLTHVDKFWHDFYTFLSGGK